MITRLITKTIVPNLSRGKRVFRMPTAWRDILEDNGWEFIAKMVKDDRQSFYRPAGNYKPELISTLTFTVPTDEFIDYLSRQEERQEIRIADATVSFGCGRAHAYVLELWGRLSINGKPFRNEMGEEEHARPGGTDLDSAHRAGLRRRAAQGG